MSSPVAKRNWTRPSPRSVGTSPAYRGTSASSRNSIGSTPRSLARRVRLIFSLPGRASLILSHLPRRRKKASTTSLRSTRGAWPLRSRRPCRFSNDGGAIIVITSIAENKGIPGFTAYSATKAAVRSFVRTWTAELKDRRIRVNAISPGPIDTPIFEQQAPTKEGADQARAQFAAAVPFGRLGRPEEIASTALFLASDEASFIAGVDLPVDGGMTAI